MICIHSHLLPGLDDGSKSLDMSLKMAEMAAADGLTHMVATPHANERYVYDRAKNQALLDELQTAVGDKLKLGLGCDFHLSFDNIQDALDNPGKYTINGKKYLLVEFADTIIPESVTDTFFELTIRKQMPIITHPERNAVLQRHPEKLADWVKAGALVQVTANSLTGRFGRTAQGMAEKFLERNWVHFLATDAHSLESRPPKMSEAYEVLKKKYGVETAERLCVVNPRAVFYGEDLGPQPKATHLPKQESNSWTPAKKGFFSRILGR